MARTNMTSKVTLASENARAYPVCNAQRPRLSTVRNELALPSHGRAWLKKLVQGVQRGAGSLNVGTMNGKNGEITEMMGRRKIEALCAQETRWKGSKARELG